MKQLIFAAFMLLAMVNLKAQTANMNGQPMNRFGNGVQNISDMFGNDSLTLRPFQGSGFIRLTLRDSVTLKYNRFNNSPGDQMQVIIEGKPGTKVKFSTLSFLSGGSMVTPALGRSIITFIWDGYNWIENTRTL